MILEQTYNDRWWELNGDLINSTVKGDKLVITSWIGEDREMYYAKATAAEDFSWVDTDTELLDVFTTGAAAFPEDLCGKIPTHGRKKLEIYVGDLREVKGVDIEWPDDPEDN